MKEFYKKYKSLVYGFVNKKVGSAEDTEELTNVILLAAWDKLPSFSGKSSLKNWILGIAKHKIIDYYRKKKLRTVLFSTVPYLEEITDKTIGPEGESLKEDLKYQIKEVLNELSEGYRNILRLKYIDEFKNSEIAIILKTSYKSVENKIRRAKIKFKQTYEAKN